ncbi:MAG: radical SAM protein [Candidatus Loosdrechtia sp.]|uniref:radical SAM protein n=1 Tax=Candidatus Loosdrechtia sp. TaxID=3101272 RepID=UPI003A67CFD3|nr:MAG: radical SAM protein [Candidatus Jettenia sp. AMX2]
MPENRRDLIKRSALADMLPLKTPFTINIGPSSACNFKCNFCCHSINKEMLKNSGFVPRTMDFELFKMVVNQIKSFPDKTKMLGLFLIGEPLLNVKLPEMVAYAKKAGVAERIFFTTNGSLLTKQLGESLISAGLDEILISVEALNAETYKNVAGVDINYQSFLNNIQHLYKNKKNCKIFIKIIYSSNKNDEIEQFHRVFDKMSDLVGKFINTMTYKY